MPDHWTIQISTPRKTLKILIKSLMICISRNIHVNLLSPDSHSNKTLHPEDLVYGP